MGSSVFRATSALPSLETNVPVIEEIHAAVATQHPDLAVLRADYIVAEKQLRLEAARAIPGFGLGASYERELGIDRVGLPFALVVVDCRTCKPPPGNSRSSSIPRRRR